MNGKLRIFFQSTKNLHLPLGALQLMRSVLSYRTHSVRLEVGGQRQCETRSSMSSECVTQRTKFTTSDRGSERSEKPKWEYAYGNGKLIEPGAGSDADGAVTQDFCRCVPLCFWLGAWVLTHLCTLSVLCLGEWARSRFGVVCR